MQWLLTIGEDEPTDCIIIPLNFMARKLFCFWWPALCFSDIDECQTLGMCSQICNNTKGSYKCSCMEGYAVEPVNHHRCKALGPEPSLLFANRYELRQLHLEKMEYRQIIDKLRSAIAIDYDYEQDIIFWSDVTLEQILW